MQKYILVILTIIVTVIAAVFPGHARWEKPNEAPAIINFEKIHYQVRKDGTYLLTVERQVEVLTDQARMDYGLFRLPVNSNQSKVEVLSAKTINGKESIEVPKEDIELKPMASSGPGFTDSQQLSVAFPQVHIGSKLYIKYQISLSKPEIPNLFSQNVPLGFERNYQQFELSVESEMPLFTQFHDPENLLKKNIQTNRIQLSLKKPFYRRVVEEENIKIDTGTLIWIGISSMKTWANLPETTIAAYEKELSAKLPKNFEKILKEASRKKTDIEKINAVTSQLAEAVRYVGDWRLVEGAFHPRSLDLIAKSGFGDCKDYTVATGAILRKLGFETRASWVGRGVNWEYSPLTLATLDFNHAILYAKKDGQEFWIDPTNVTSFAQGIYPDIEDRPAAVLVPGGKSFVKKTPAIRAEDRKVEVMANLDFSKSPRVKVRGDFFLGEQSILHFTAAQLSNSKSSLDYHFIKWITETKDLESWKIGPYDLTSRIVEPKKISYEYVKLWNSIQTSFGEGFLIPSEWIRIYEFQRKDRTSHVAMGFPTDYKKTFKITGRSLKLNKELHCQGKSSWADFSRKLYQKNGVTFLEEEFFSKRSSILKKEFQSPELSKFMADLKTCMKDLVLVFDE